MKHRLLLLTLMLSALLALPVRADNLVYSVFGDYLESLRAQTGIPGMAATIVSSTTTVWERAFGVQDVDKNKFVTLDTPFEIDGLTQSFVASLALRCDESGWISIDDSVGKYVPSSPDAGATLRMLMTHTSPGASGLTFAYRLDRLAPMSNAISACTDSSYRAGIGALLDRMGMYDSVPGSDAATALDEFDARTAARYADVVSRLAMPYAVDSKGRATASTYPAKSLTASAGMISTARDLAKFDVALKSGLVVRPASLALAWTAPATVNGQVLPHGIGWFVQTYQGEPVVWQFGVADNASSSMVVMLPRRGLTLIVLANSAGLVQSFNLAAGDLTSSPFARVFLGTFVR